MLSSGEKREEEGKRVRTLQLGRVVSFRCYPEEDLVCFLCFFMSCVWCVCGGGWVFFFFFFSSSALSPHLATVTSGLLVRDLNLHPDFCQAALLPDVKICIQLKSNSIKLLFCLSSELPPPFHFIISMSLFIILFFVYSAGLLSLFDLCVCMSGSLTALPCSCVHTRQSYELHAMHAR